MASSRTKRNARRRTVFKHVNNVDGIYASCLMKRNEHMSNCASHLAERKKHIASAVARGDTSRIHMLTSIAGLLGLEDSQILKKFING
jgi:hypothetical protein